MKLSLRHFVYLSHLALLHVGTIWIFFNFSLLWFLISCGVYLALQSLGGNIALHRYLSHASFTTGPLRQRFLIVLGNLTCLGSSLSWVSTHRHHHQFADQQKDCHSPHHLGILRILLGFWNAPDEVVRSLKALPLFTWHLFFHRWYYVLHFLIMGLLMWLDWRLFAYVYALPNLAVYYALYAVVIFCHRRGYRNFETPDHSANNPLVATITLGEGWHNNHHQNPQSHRNTVRSLEWDPTARIIEIFFITKKN
jgi:stearoyl-CoA desaturase (Delta-9 desaturase)